MLTQISIKTKLSRNPSFLNMAAVIALLLLSACAKKEYIALTTEAEKNLESSDVYLVKAQEKMGVEIEHSNTYAYSGAGLLFALVDSAIDSSRMSTAQKACTPVNDCLKQLHLGKIIDEKIATVIHKAPWLHTQDVQYISDASKKMVTHILEASPKDGTMVTQVHYKLSPKFDYMTGIIFVDLYPTSEKMKTLAKTKDPYGTPIFRTRLQVKEHLKNGTSNIHENVEIWTANNGAQLKETLNSLTSRMAADLELKMQNPKIILNHQSQ